MRPFRHPLLSRLLALLLLTGFAGWVGAPLASAHPEAKAAQLARVHAAGPVEGAVAEALAAAARADDAPTAFSEALQAALAAQPDGGPLAAYLAEAGGLDALLDLLVGQLLRSLSTPTPLWTAAPASALAASASGPRDVGPTSSPDAARAAEPTALAVLPAPPPALDQALCPTAQPRGP